MALTPAMKYSGQWLNETAQLEGIRLIAYQDIVGVWTIGAGHTQGVTKGETCTYAQALSWLSQDLQQVENSLNSEVDVTLTQGEFDALVDFGFNLGIHAMESSTLWKFLQEGDFRDAATQFPRWDHAGGKEVAGLLHRRLLEEARFKSSTPISQSPIPSV